MTPTDSLRLVKPDDDPPDVYRMERRNAIRHSLSARVTAVRKEYDSDGPRNQIWSRQLVNISDTGLGALIQEPLEPGSHLAIYFPPHGPDRGFDLFGRVVRCIPRDTGHEIGVQFQTRMAA